MKIIGFIIGIILTLIGLVNIQSDSSDKDIFYRGIKQIIIGVFIIIIGILI